MSINCSRGPGIFFWDGEVVKQEHSNVTTVLKKNTHANEHLKGTKHGSIYLTNFRLIFRTKGSKDMLQELSMPFKQIKDFEIKQPVFGANLLYGKLIAEQNGGWEGSVIFEITFKDGGAIEVGKKLIDLATKPLQPQYTHRTIAFAQSGAYMTGPGAPYPPPQHHYVPQAPMYSQQGPQYQPAPMYPPPYQMPSTYPPQYAPNPNQPQQQIPQQPGSSLPPGYDPYQMPPAYNATEKTG